ncbi:MAG: HAD hydrolase-like protein [Pseudomonadota bacterium]|nr:HAD hydrolase-like protein [Pseudomonadota bacterium]
MTVSLAGLSIPAPEAITLDDIIAMYEALRPHMPPAVPPAVPTREVSRLVEILPHVDALILDGFGVINVGARLIDGIGEVLELAAARDVAVMVLTNGAGQGAAASWAKYRDWGLPITRPQVVSSRDALEAALPAVAAGRIVAALGPAARPLGIGNELTLAADADLFDRADCFAFLGSAGWDESLQAALEGALTQGGRDLFVGNPDISAPLGGAFSAEPGYWAVRAMQATGVQPRWYGKPHRAAFDLALARLEQVHGRPFARGRVAMVGDSLHTDILGARAAGLQAVLLTGYGLFCDGGAHDMIGACGIAPDWIAATL